MNAKRLGYVANRIERTAALSHALGVVRHHVECVGRLDCPCEKNEQSKANVMSTNLWICSQCTEGQSSEHKDQKEENLRSLLLKMIEQMKEQRHEIQEQMKEQRQEIKEQRQETHEDIRKLREELKKQPQKIHSEINEQFQQMNEQQQKLREEILEHQQKMH